MKNLTNMAHETGHGAVDFKGNLIIKGKRYSGRETEGA